MEQDETVRLVSVPLFTGEEDYLKREEPEMTGRIEGKGENDAFQLVPSGSLTNRGIEDLRFVRGVLRAVPRQRSVLELEDNLFDTLIVCRTVEVLNPATDEVSLLHKMRVTFKEHEQDAWERLFPPAETQGILGAVCLDDTHEPLPLPLEVLSSPAGHYLGYRCPQCGPYSRETEYFRSRPEAEEALEDPKPFVRNPE